MQTTAVIFEGGPLPTNDLQRLITGLRHAVTLDSLEKYLASGVEQVVLATNFPGLGREAERMGVRVWDTRQEDPFHFGRVLKRVVREIEADAVLYCSGAALPLISTAEIHWVLETLKQHGACVVVNNLQSVDFVAWNPARYVEQIEPPENDNTLGWLLREIGMERVLLPHSAGIHFDLDTPTDYLILGLSGLGGRRTKEALDAIQWPSDRLIRAAGILATDLPEVALIGRVGTPIIDHMNRNLRVRLRIFSEERGMKALRREETGSVTSLVADIMDELGPMRFFQHLESICSAAFFDTRVVFANKGRRVTEWDRYHSDLGRVDRISDPWVAAFTEAALACKIPVVLGGHSVVSGGLWVLADRVIPSRSTPHTNGSTKNG